jgi:hypothetical protein
MWYLLSLLLQDIRPAGRNPGYSDRFFVGCPKFLLTLQARVSEECRDQGIHVTIFPFFTLTF